MKVFFINLDRDAERRIHMVERLGQLGFVSERVEATLGRSLTEKQLTSLYSDCWAKLFRSRSLAPAEIGCALSHLETYRRILAQDLDFALILEDDTVLPDELPNFLASLMPVIKPDRAEIYLLSPSVGAGSVAEKRLANSNYRISSYREGFYASAYVVTRAAARQLLVELAPVRDVADCWDRISQYGVFHMYVVSPALVQQDQPKFGSSTTADINASRTGVQNSRARHLLARAVSIFFSKAYAVFRRLKSGLAQ